MPNKRLARRARRNARGKRSRTLTRSTATPKDTGTLDLALRILDHLAEQTTPIALTSIAQTFSASKSTVYRHLSALARHGFVRRDVSTGRYAIGVKLMVLGEMSRSNFEIVTGSTQFIAPKPATSQVAAVREAARSVSRELGWKVESMDVLNTRFGVYK